MEVKDWRFPMACPKCQAATAFPYNVTTDGLIIVDIRCRSCHHQWVLSSPMPPFFLRQKEEFRKPRPKARTLGSR
jgi:hypothetical protein